MPNIDPGVLPIATASAVGVVKDGSGVSVLSDGTLALNGNGIRNCIRKAKMNSSGVLAYLSAASEANSAPTNMTSDSAPAGYVASAGSEGASWPAYQAFDGSNSTFWNTASGVTNSFIQIQMPTAITALAVAITARSDSAANQSPASFTVVGSNNGTTWTTLATVTGSTGWSLGERRRFPLTTTGSFTYYRLNITTVDGGSYIAIATLELLTGAGNTLTLEADANDPFCAIAANGLNGAAALDTVGPELTANVVNPWGTLTAASAEWGGMVNYLYVDLTASPSSYTYGFTTVKPLVRLVLPSSPTSGQDVYNPITGVTWHYNGSWSAVQRVYIGTVLVDSVGNIFGLSMDPIGVGGGAISPYGSRFFAYQTAQQSIPATTNTKVTFGATLYDCLGEWDSVNSRFTAAIPGWYIFTAATTTSSGAITVDFALYKNGIGYMPIGGQASANQITVVSPPIYLDAGDYIELCTWWGTAGNTILTGSNGFGSIGTYGTYFSGYRLA